MQAGGGGGSGSHQTGLAHPSVGQTYNIQGVFSLVSPRKVLSMELVSPNQFQFQFQSVPALRAARTDQPAVAEMPTHSFVQPATRLKP